MGMTDKQWKGYLRGELQDQKDIIEALENKEYDLALKLAKRLAERTQQNIED